MNTTTVGKTGGPDPSQGAGTEGGPASVPGETGDVTVPDDAGTPGTEATPFAETPIWDGLADEYARIEALPDGTSVTVLGFERGYAHAPHT